MEHVLITGGAGFIGSHTVDLFLQQGVKVTVIDNLSTGKLNHLNLTHPQLTFIEEDILNYPALLAVIKNCDAILHLAALPSVPKSIENPRESLQINLLGFLNILQAVRETKRTIRLVYASSAAVYGDNTLLPLKEESISSHDEVLSPYALEKSSNERYAMLYAKLFGIKSLGLRYFNVYGKRQDPRSSYSGVISKFISHYQKDTPLTIFGDGEQSRDFINVADVAKANWLAIQAHYHGILNIATASSETINQLVQYIEAAGEKPAKVHYTPARSGDIKKSQAFTEKAKHHLGFQYTINLKEGVRNLVANGIE